MRPRAQAAESSARFGEVRDVLGDGCG
jgi:hypothetical protein